MYVEAYETSSKRYIFFLTMRLSVMFITAVCVLFLVKLRWPKKKSIYDKIKGQLNDLFITLLNNAVQGGLEIAINLFLFAEIEDYNVFFLRCVQLYHLVKYVTNNIKYIEFFTDKLGLNL